MGNPEHIEWLREGVESWNKRRENEEFTPDFESEDFVKIFDGGGQGVVSGVSLNLKDINLSDAKLVDAYLGKSPLVDLSDSFAIDLTDADFTNATLDRASFVRADLTNADFSHANLNEASFYRSDLINADFYRADLKKSRFQSCNLKDAHFYSADVIDTDFILSRPWETRLYHRTLTQVSVPSETPVHGRLETIEDLLKACRDFKEGISEVQRTDIVLYFRGESSCSWELRPSVMRKPALRSTESEMLNDLMTRQPEAFSGLGSALAQWVLAQHHGLKTRLLDITRNPLVALFYSCADEGGELDDKDDGILHVFLVPKSLIKLFSSDTMSVIASFAKLSRSDQNLLLGKTVDDTKDDDFPSLLEFQERLAKAKDGLYDIIRQERPTFREWIDARDLFRVFVVEPQQMFERIRAQSGAFLISAFHERFEWNQVLQWNQDTPIYIHHQFEVSKDEKSQMLQDLRLLNVTRETLVPGVDETARAITQHYLSATDGNQTYP